MLPANLSKVRILHFLFPRVPLGPEAGLTDVATGGAMLL